MKSLNVLLLNTDSARAFYRVCSLALFLSLFAFLGEPDALAQQGESPPDTNEVDDWGEEWTLDSLNPEDFEFDTEQIYNLSRGWFPTPNKGMSLSLFSDVLYSDVHDRASQLHSQAFYQTAVPFGWRDPYRCGFFDYLLDDGFLFDLFGGCEERTILTRDDETSSERYPVSDYGEYGLRFNYHLPLPAILRFDGSYRRTDGILFAEDTSKSYLSYDGVPRGFREISVLHHKQHAVSGVVGLQIPVYGVFLDSDFGAIGSYYYIAGGLGGDFSLVTYTTQYAQIADAKSQLRYSNNQDTVRQMHSSNTDGISRLRTSIETAVGWGFNAEFFVIGAELFLSVPTESLVDDGAWKQYYAGLRVNIGGQWGTTARGN